jgi:catechol 2,3-dioxygenase-like lactoylglutathione lyase family enzyme
MIKTHGLTHIALAVKNPERSLKFYKEVFGVKEYYRDENQIQVLGPGEYDVIAFQKDSKLAGKKGGVLHFGFRLTNPKDINRVVTAVRKAKGTIVEQGAFSPQEPYTYIKDPDGYVVEIWYEK